MFALNFPRNEHLRKVSVSNWNESKENVVKIAFSSSKFVTTNATLCFSILFHNFSHSHSPHDEVDDPEGQEEQEGEVGEGQVDDVDVRDRSLLDARGNLDARGEHTFGYIQSQTAARRSLKCDQRSPRRLQKQQPTAQRWSAIRANAPELYK